jgi:RNA-directed DNA polymerase
LVGKVLRPFFYKGLYGYKFNKSETDAVGIARWGCRKYDYVIDWDIKGLFGDIDNELLMKVMQKRVNE